MALSFQDKIQPVQKAPATTTGLSFASKIKPVPIIPKKTEEPGTLSKVGTFLKEEFTPKGGDVSTLPYGTQTIGSIFQSTFGSKAAAGVGTQTAKTLMLPKTVGDIKSVEQANLANVSALESINKMIEMAKAEQDPERKRKLFEQANQDIRQSSQIGEQSKQNLQQLQQNIPDPRKIIEAGFNTALTASMGGAKGLGSGEMVKTAITEGVKKFAPSVLPIAEKALSYGRSVLSRAIEQGAAGAAFTAASNIGENRPVQEGTLSSAIIGSLFPVVGLGLSKGAEALRKGISKMGVGVENTMLKATPKMFAYGKNPGQGILKEGITFNNFDEGIQKVDDAISKNVDEAKNVIAQAKAVNPSLSISLRDTTKYIDEALIMAEKTPKTNSALITRLSNIKDDILGYLKGGVDYQDPNKAIELKQLIGKLTKFTGNVSDDKEVNMALKRTYGMLMDKTEKIIPGLGDVNGRIADLITAKTALENRSLATESGKVIKIGTNMGRIGALIFGTATLNPGIIAAAISEYGAEKIAESPAVRSRIAMWLYKASPAERADIASKAPIIGGIINKIFGIERKPSIQKIEKELEMLALPPAGKSGAPLITQPPTTFEKGVSKAGYVQPTVEPKPILPKKAEGVIPKTTEAVAEPVIPKETTKLADLKNQLEIYNTMIDEHPAFPLTKFANKRTQELPEVIGGVSGRFGREGDSIVTEYGFSSSEDARDAYQHLVTLRQQRDAIKEAISNEKAKVSPVKKSILPKSITAYHGTQAKEIRGIPNKTKGSIGNAFYLSDDKLKAEKFGKDSKVINSGTKSLLRKEGTFPTSNVYEFDLSKLKIKEFKSDSELFKEVKDPDIESWMKLAGYDGVYIKNTGTYAIYNPEKLIKVK